jgi:very-short-patch-repair endonuclease
MRFMTSLPDIAERQHGLFTRVQAQAAGTNRNLIARRVRRGEWTWRTPHVLAIAGTPETPQAKLLAAVLHVGVGAVVSHRAAAALFGIPGFGLHEVNVTRPLGRRWDPPPYGELHVMPLPADQVTVVDGIPCTTVPRTLFDLAASEQFAQRVERAVDNALAMRLTTVAALHDLVRHSKGRPGVRRMRELLADRQGAYVPPASELEARFLELVRAAGLPMPTRQASIGDEQPVGRVDMLWRDERLIAELDSRRHHSARLDAQNDVRRDVAAANAGYRTLRITWDDVYGYPERTMDRLADALDDCAMRRAS